MHDPAKNIYGINDRYMSKLQKDILLNLIIIAVFYFCFNVMFMQNPGYEEYIQNALLLLFILIAVAVVYSDILRIRKFDSIHYKLTSNYLEYFDGKESVRYHWNAFTAVVINKNKVGLTYPYEFQTEDGNFYLNKRIGDMETLIPAILDRIRSHAQIDPEIPEVFLPRDSIMDEVRRYV